MSEASRLSSNRKSAGVTFTSIFKNELFGVIFLICNVPSEENTPSPNLNLVYDGFRV